MASVLVAVGALLNPSGPEFSAMGFFWTIVALVLALSGSCGAALFDGRLH
jgi:hypothetical protein